MGTAVKARKAPRWRATLRTTETISAGTLAAIGPVHVLGGSMAVAMLSSNARRRHLTIISCVTIGACAVAVIRAIEI